MNKKKFNFTEASKTFVSIIIPLAAVFTSVFNLYVASQLAPLYQSQAILVEKVRAIEENNFLDMKTFELFKVDIIHRLDIISSRLDSLIAQHIKD